MAFRVPLCHRSQFPGARLPCQCWHTCTPLILFNWPRFWQLENKIKLIWMLDKSSRKRVSPVHKCHCIIRQVPGNVKEDGKETTAFFQIKYSTSRFSKLNSPSLTAKYYQKQRKKEHKWNMEILLQVPIAIFCYKKLLANAPAKTPIGQPAAAQELLSQNKLTENLLSVNLHVYL